MVNYKKKKCFLNRSENQQTQQVVFSSKNEPDRDTLMEGKCSPMCHKKVNITLSLNACLGDH